MRSQISCRFRARLSSSLILSTGAADLATHAPFSQESSFASPVSGQLPPVHSAQVLSRLRSRRKQKAQELSELATAPGRLTSEEHNSE